MENILVAINAESPDVKTIEFACYVARLTSSKLTGAFLENMAQPERPVMRKLFGVPYVETIVAGDLPEYDLKKRQWQETINSFSEICTRHSLSFYIHRERVIPMDELVAETRFADLMIINPATTLTGENERVPTSFVKTILNRTECPVIISPQNFESVNELFFAFDGGKSAVFAIKQFSYLFPEFSNKKITVLHVADNDENATAWQDGFTELISSHYSSINFQVLKGTADEELSAFLLGKKNAFLVMGAFGRGVFSGMLRKSAAELLINSVGLPIFIAHR